MEQRSRGFVNWNQLQSCGFVVLEKNGQEVVLAKKMEVRYNKVELILTLEEVETLFEKEAVLDKSNGKIEFR